MKSVRIGPHIHGLEDLRRQLRKQASGFMKAESYIVDSPGHPVEASRFANPTSFQPQALNWQCTISPICFRAEKIQCLHMSTCMERPAGAPGTMKVSWVIWQYRGLNYLNRVFGDHCTISIIRNPQKSIGNYFGPYIMSVEPSPPPMTTTSPSTSQVADAALTLAWLQQPQCNHSLGFRGLGFRVQLESAGSGLGCDGRV